MYVCGQCVQLPGAAYLDGLLASWALAGQSSSVSVIPHTQLSGEFPSLWCCLASSCVTDPTADNHVTYRFASCIVAPAAALLACSVVIAPTSCLLYKQSSCPTNTGIILVIQASIIRASKPTQQATCVYTHSRFPLHACQSILS
jgi:hypothetical protein